MDHLWTPWRYHYISTGPELSGCVFCRIRDDDPREDEGNFVLARTEYNFLILNRFPYTSGHLLVVLNRHVASISDASPVELHEIIDLAGRCERAVQAVYRPEGFNIGFNLGKCAGAGVEGHLHLHIVPRWTGDSNVVSVLGETRIIPESLEDTFQKLCEALGKR